MTACFGVRGLYSQCYRSAMIVLRRTDWVGMDGQTEIRSS